MTNTYKSKGLARLDHNLLVETRERALTLQLDQKFIELIEKEIKLREKSDINSSINLQET
ncbi:sporulation histidine kinase inhibitor Sda [Halalkalibacter okhensis]|uniref:Sporulation protein n=1 Tax=Halalkalibacter okhensis TaxID=333138 RepID=A0A0B0IHM7_9BACI|nr:sporulation histidine kinase inhibitor Sda [Halalkalibacter okhensis]KHF39574.1 hypothetical protein LQ50_14100 [Halalkalibacter okhensis]